MSRQQFSKHAHTHKSSFVSILQDNERGGLTNDIKVLLTQLPRRLHSDTTREAKAPARSQCEICINIFLCMRSLKRGDSLPLQQGLSKSALMPEWYYCRDQILKVFCFKRLIFPSEVRPLWCLTSSVPWVSPEVAKLLADQGEEVDRPLVLVTTEGSALCAFILSSLLRE